MNTLETRRKANRYSIRLLSKELGCSYEWYRKCESNTELLKIRMLRQLIEKLNLTNKEILKIIKGE